MLLQAYQDLTNDHALLLLKMTLFSWQEDSADNTTQELRLFMHLELYICAMNGLQ